MAFNVIDTYGDADTVKDTEFVRVQIVQVSNKAGDVTNRIEARLNVDNPVNGYTGPTKTALVFNEAAQIDDLIAALEAAKADFAALPTPQAAQAAPRVQRVRAKRANAPKAVA